MLGGTRGRDLRQGLIGDGVERRRPDHLHGIRQIAAHLRTDVHHDIAQICNLHIQLAKRCAPVLPDTRGGTLDEQAITVDLQLPSGLLNRRPSLFIAPLSSAQHAVGGQLHAQALKRRFDSEHTLVVAGKRKAVQGAFDFDRGLAKAACQ